MLKKKKENSTTTKNVKNNNKTTMARDLLQGYQHFHQDLYLDPYYIIQ